MSANRSRRIDRHTAERLLRGEPDGAPEALSGLLAAASAPPRDGELAGEQAALAAFRTARLRPVPQSRRWSMVKTSLAKLTTVKIGVAAAAVLVTIGGVAFATAGGTLPDRGGTPPELPTVATSPGPGEVSGKDPSTVPGGPPAATDKPKGDNGKSDSNPSPSPSLVGLCHAYTAGAGAEHGKALENPAFSYLILTAGGEDKVAGYCDNLLATRPGKPGPPENKPAHPAGPGDTRPTDKPKDAPRPNS